MVLGLIIRVLNPELRRVLILAVFLDDDHQTVVRGVGLQVFTGRPFELALVVDFLGQRVDRFHVLAGPAEQDDGDGTFRVGFPFYGIGFSGFDGVVDAGFGECVAFRGVVVVGRFVGCCQCEEGCKECYYREMHVACFASCRL